MRAPQLRRLRGRGDPVALIVAVVRVSLLPVAVLGEHATRSPTADVTLLEAAFGVAAVYSLFALAFAVLGRRPVRLAPFVVCDLVLIGAVTYAAGGADAHILFMYAIPPVVAAFLGGPRETALIGAASVVCYVAAASLAPPPDVAHPAAAVAVQAMNLTWRSLLFLALSVLLARRERRIARLAESRRVLVTQSLQAEDRARRELAYVLHDDVIQSLLAVRQDLSAAEKGRPGAIERARRVLDAAVGQLRDEVSALHPHQLETVGLAAALRTVASDKARSGGFRPEVTVADDAVGDHDELVLALVRELLQNAAKHAEADVVRVDVQRQGDAVVLRYADDGRGIDEARREAALREGHLGLAACAERVAAIGGELEVRSAPGRGTAVRAVLPPTALLRSPAFL